MEIGVPVNCETKGETKYTETKRNEIHRNETKSMRNEINRNEIDRNETKRYNTKWNKIYFNETISWGKYHLSVEKDSSLFSRLYKKNRSSSSNDEMIDSSIVDC